MALNARQQRAYKHLCNIWSVTRTVDSTTGKPGDETYALYASNVPCLYEYTANVDDPSSGGGRIKRMIIVTTDKIHMEASQHIEDQWLLKNVSKLPDGSNHPNYGEVHRVLGVPRVIANAGARRGNKKSVMAMVEEHPPLQLA